jgi:hypothetical protein
MCTGAGVFVTNIISTSSQPIKLRGAAGLNTLYEGYAGTANAFTGSLYNSTLGIGFRNSADSALVGYVPVGTNDWTTTGQFNGAGTGITGTASSLTCGAALYIPQSSNTTMAAADTGKCITATGNVTIPNSVMTANSIVTIFNNTSTPITIVSSLSTLYLAGTASTGNRILAQRGLASVYFLSSTVGAISGAGLT